MNYEFNFKMNIFYVSKFRESRAEKFTRNVSFYNLIFRESRAKRVRAWDFCEAKIKRNIKSIFAHYNL